MAKHVDYKAFLTHWMHAVKNDLGIEHVVDNMIGLSAQECSGIASQLRKRLAAQGVVLPKFEHKGRKSNISEQELTDLASIVNDA